jgi:hypothetical protein
MTYTLAEQVVAYVAEQTRLHGRVRRAPSP